MRWEVDAYNKFHSIPGNIARKPNKQRHFKAKNIKVVIEYQRVYNEYGKLYEAGMSVFKLKIPVNGKH